MKKTCIFKQRQAIKMLCDKNFVKLNGKYVKPAKDVNVGDIIEIETIKGIKQLKVLRIPQGNVRKNEKNFYYEEIS